MKMQASALPSTDSIPNAHFFAAVERSEEMARLQAQAQSRKCMLIHGPEGVGKTRLLRAFAKTQPLALYVEQTHSPRDLVLALADSLRSLSKRGLRLPSEPKSLSTISLKGVIQRVLDEYPFLLVLDHLSGPSSVITRLIKQMNYYGRTPVLFAGRTPHMEDIGALQPMCADRSERLELKNFSPSVALEFAKREAADSGLRASNLEQALHDLAGWSDGNPACIAHMIMMARLPQYRAGDQIKAHVVYLDYRMGRR